MTREPAALVIEWKVAPTAAKQQSPSVGPVLFAQIVEKQLAELVDATERDRKSHLMLAPKVTTFNGQTASTIFPAAFTYDSTPQCTYTLNAATPNLGKTAGGTSLTVTTQTGFPVAANPYDTTPAVMHAFPAGQFTPDLLG